MPVGRVGSRPPMISSGVSYGSLGKNAVAALNLGAKLAGCYHTTGEGGISPARLFGAGPCWQIGTGYCGARALEGEFSLARLPDTVERVRGSG